MNREQLGLALALSLPVGVGVSMGVLKQTLGSQPITALGAGLGAGGLVFLAVAGAMRTPPEREGPGRLARLAERVVPDAETTTPVDVVLGAGMGALVTLFLWYIPLSPLLGGATAGFLQGGSREDARTAGTLAGALVPLLALVAGGTAFLVAGARVFGTFPFGPGIALGLALAAVVYSVGLGRLGGWIGGVVLEDQREWGQQV